MIRATGSIVLNMILLLLDIYLYIILFRVIFAWFMPRSNSIFQFLVFVTEPVLAPIRKKIEPLMRKSAIPIDPSPIVVVLLVSIIRQLLLRLF